MNIMYIPALQDNYIWLLYNKNKECLVVDPGTAEEVLNIVKKMKLTLVAIFLTHHHYDHVNGVKKILEYFPAKVYGPWETINKGTNYIVTENESIFVLQKIWKILFLPGHTLGHIGFYSIPWLFCGDTVFSAGCGRIFEGTEYQMYKSLLKIKQLPLNTLIYSAHEYTLKNINFAYSIFNNDLYIKNYLDNIQQLYKNKKSSLPSILSTELKINPFFRCREILNKRKIEIHTNSSIFQEECKIFSELRKKRDEFNIQ